MENQETKKCQKCGDKKSGTIEIGAVPIYFFLCAILGLVSYGFFRFFNWLF